MPPANETAQLDKLLRTLIFGPSKARKTTWCLQAAAAGFNVILLDGDDGSHVIKTQTKKEWQHRILVVDVVDTLDRAVFAPFLGQLYKRGNYFTWDEQLKATREGVKDPTHSHIQFDVRKLTSNDILVLDSWTALAGSTGWRYAEEKEIDLSDAAKTEWDGYGWQGRFLDFVLKTNHALPCHVVVIAHSTVYEKWDRSDKKNPKLLWSKTIPISASGPHGMKLPKEFSDVLYFDRESDVRTMISSSGDKERDGGSRFLPPQKYRWSDAPQADPKNEELSLAGLLQIAGYKGTNAPLEGAIYRPPGFDFGAAKKSSPLVKPKEVNGAVQKEAPIANPGGGILAKIRMGKEEKESKM